MYFISTLSSQRSNLVHGVQCILGSLASHWTTYILNTLMERRSTSAKIADGKNTWVGSSIELFESSSYFLKIRLKYHVDY
jgi:hypothetical protein